MGFHVNCILQVSAVKKKKGQDQGPAKGTGPCELTLTEVATGPVGSAASREGVRSGKPHDPSQSWGARIRREFPS